MIEDSWLPGNRVMAGGAGGWETTGNVVGIGSFIEVRHMAGDAVGRKASPLAAHVALRAWHGQVRSRERKLREGGMVEAGAAPGDGCMAGEAIVGQVEHQVRWIRTRIEIFLMAGEACSRSRLEVVIEVAGAAIQLGVRSGESEAGEAQVVKLSTGPGIERVATLACGGKVQGAMIDDRSLIVLRMAGEALRRQPYELTGGGVLMAGVALQQGVGAYERKAVLMVADRLDRDLPALYGMALLAIRSELALMNVRVAVRASRTDIAEDKIHMALGAVNLGVHTPQRIACLIVVELGDVSDRLPSGKRMAILARVSECSVRASDLGARCRRRLLSGRRRSRKER